ncbi:MAG: MFS transporter [Dehalococcoidales bacterium]|nr:MAG: MFS transporter [Dehalococcoidales bacterium]
MTNLFDFIKRKTQGIFFGWWIVVSGCILQTLHSGLLGQGFTVYFLHLQEEFGWSRTLLSTGFSLSNIVNGVLAPFEGWLSDRFGPRRLVLTGMVMLGAGFMFLSSVQSIVSYFLAFALIACGASLGGYLPISIAVLNWFVRKRSMALGIASAGHGLGGLVVLVVAWSVVNNGWRPTALVSGIAILVIGTICALFLRQRPEKYGYLPDGDRPASGKSRTQETQAQITDSDMDLQSADDFTIQEAIKSRSFWLIAAGHASAVLTISAVSLHLAPHLVQRMDMSLETAGSIVSLLLFMSIVGRIAGGVFADRVDKRWLLVGSMISHTIGLLLLANATTMFQIVLFTIFHGIAWGARGLIQNSIRAEYFGRKAIGSILGIASIPVVIAIVVSPIFTAWLADLNGDYHFAFSILAAYTAAGTLFFAFAKKPVRD